jgi:hypothetical protein
LPVLAIRSSAARWCASPWIACGRALGFAAEFKKLVDKPLVRASGGP